MSSLQQVTKRVRSSVGTDSGLDARIKFKFSDQEFLFIDGRSRPNRVDNSDSESDITITVSRENFEKIIDHQLKPPMALMTGRMRLRGDIRIAMRLNKVFGIAD